MTQVPFPGGSGAVPTGPLQFQDDWPGLWLRGDTCAALLPTLRELLKHASPASLPITCTPALLTLAKLADTIEREVIVRNNPAA